MIEEIIKLLKDDSSYEDDLEVKSCFVNGVINLTINLYEDLKVFIQKDGSKVFAVMYFNGNIFHVQEIETNESIDHVAIVFATAAIYSYAEFNN